MSETNADPKKSGGRPIIYVAVAVAVIALGYFALTTPQGQQASSPQQAVAEEPAAERVAGPHEGAPPVSAQDSQVRPDWY